jgi:hypothetical protein
MAQDALQNKISIYTTERIGSDGRRWYGWEMMPQARMLQLFYRMQKSARTKEQAAKVEAHMKMLEAKMGIV